MTLVVLLALLALDPQQSAKPVDDMIERLATCQDSWRDWKDNPAQTKKVAELFNGAFTQAGNDGSFAPKDKVQVVGLPVTQVYPESVGMGVGFSVVLTASFDTARAHVEKATGKTLKNCERSDGMRTCEFEIAPERTIALMSGDKPTESRTLLGCYYLYEK